MSEKFTASNGVEIKVCNRGLIGWSARLGHHAAALALFEFYEHKMKESRPKWKVRGWPKPWHDAKPGEVWMLTTDGENHPWAIDTLFTDRFVYAGGDSNIPVDHPSITAGRRIWPEVS